MLLPPPFFQFCVKILLIVVAIDVIFLCQSSNAEEWEETMVAKQLDDGILDPSLFFDVNDPHWLSWIGQFSKGIDRCSSLNTDEFNSVRVCTRAQFYGPAGVEAMKRTRQLYAEHRNDMVLVLVSGCIVCPVGFGDGEMTMKLMQFHPEGSMFTSCDQEWENVRSIKIRPKVGTTKPISFIMGAVFAKRRCKGLFSTDKVLLQYDSHFISVENIRCGPNNKHSR
uniref:Secreted protein n=1 Tax=Globodera pallida TaxID=36090 RepID=A0A183C848_GLOPA